VHSAPISFAQSIKNSGKMMSITVNGVEITDVMIAAESQHHQDAPSAIDATVQELILRELLLQRAATLSIEAASPEETIGLLLQTEVKITDPDEAACQQYYDNNPQSFVRGETLEGSHILFKAGETEPVDTVLANAVLAEVKANPEKFEELARQHSSCPSGQQGGNLGQFGRGQMVPEFEQVAFSLNEGEIAADLVETRFGLHIIRAGSKAEGAMVSFDEVKAKLAEFLSDVATRRAMNQYLQTLVNAAKIEGYTLPSPDAAQ
jgi:peptidyl-prolyl cis-trans isomerase C